MSRCGRLSACLHSNGLRSKYPDPEWSLGNDDEGSTIGRVPQKYVRKTKQPASATGIKIFRRKRSPYFRAAA
jgi:hypothetical protein